MRNRLSIAAGFRTVVVLAMFVAASLVGALPANAAVINVTTTADGGAGSLRAAFDTANGNTEADEIVLASGATYELSSCGPAGEEGLNANGDLDHTPDEGLTIRGNGSTIKNTCPDERVIDLVGGGGLTLLNTTITGGKPLSSGGGIDSIAASVTLVDSVVTGNTAGFAGANSGGGIYTSNGAVSITGSTLSGNTANGGDGGALRISSGALTITDSELSGNTATNGQGGAAYTSSSEISITSSTLSGNTASSHGGAIRTSSGAFTLTDSTLSDNKATTGAGGALYTSSSQIAVTRSTLSGNTAGDDGGAIRNSSSLSISFVDSTFSGNTAAAQGGVVRTSDGTLTLTNVTLSGNTATGEGGGIYSSSGQVTTNNATIAGNTAPAGTGGGIHNGTGTTTLSNSIIAGNPGGDCDISSGTPISLGYNISGDASCGLTGPGDKPSTDPMLGPLADNGGPTQTRVLLAGSPAIDAGNPAPPGSGGAACAATDQRGLPRSACDIGAYELIFCKKVPVNEIGTEGNDTLTGGDEANGVLAFGGNDTVNTGGGNDVVCAGTGNDKVNGGGGKDALYGEAGKDKLNGGGGKDLVSGGGGKDTCNGGPGKDKGKACEKEKKL